MEREGLAPSVKDGREAELSAEVLRVAGEGLERLARRTEEQIVDDAGPREGQPPELLGQREHDVEVR